MNKFQDFLTTNGFYADFINTVEKFGIIKNNNIDPSFTNFKVGPGTTTGTIKINPGFAYDKNRNRIILPLVDNINVPIDGHKYYVKISYLPSVLELGTVSISTSGYMTGVGTQFTKSLRGQPNFPSLISFPNSVFNLLQYEVLNIIDDQNAQLQGVFTTAETALQYNVVGTYTPGIIMATADEFPFQYDNCVFTLVQDSAVLPGQYYPQLLKDQEFIIGVVSNVGGVVTINDTRLDFTLYSKEERLLNEMPRTVLNGYNVQKQNPLIAVTSIKNLVVNNVSFYQINLDWKFTITNSTFDRVNSKITITAGSGGAYKNIASFKAGDFDGWRLYYNHSGDYSVVLSSVINGSGTIDCYLDSIPPAIGFAINNVPELNNLGIYLCPNAEEVEIAYNIPFSDASPNFLKQEKKLFKVSSLNPQIFIRADELYKVVNLTIPTTWNYKTALRQPNY